MKYYYTIKQVVGGVFLAATLGVALTATAQDSLVATGIVSSGSTLLNSTNAVSGVVSVIDQGTGDHDIVVDSVGAFAGNATTDFVVEVTNRQNDSDNYSYGRVILVTDDQLTVTIRSVDLEDSVDPDFSIPINSGFGFVIRKINSVSSTIESGTSHLIGLGHVSATGTLISGFGVNGISISPSGAGGDYDVTLQKTGAFTGDNNNDYVVMATVRASSLIDRIPTLYLTSIASDDSVTFNIRIHDVQTAVAANTGTLDGDEFYFSVYRIPSTPGNGVPESQLLLAAANVNGSGLLAAGGTSIPGGVVNATDVGVGEYEVTITALGAFAGKTGGQYMAIASIRSSGLTDRIVAAYVTKPNDNSLLIQIPTQDVEENGEEIGLPEDQSFAVAVYDTGALLQPDLRIGTKKNVTKMKGNNRINTNGAGQGIKVKLPGTAKKRFYFAVENDGTSTDAIKFREKGAGNILKTRYFSLTGGRKNITAKVRTQSEAISDLRPGRIARIEAQAKYKSSSKTPTRKVRIKGTSMYDPGASDTVKAKTVALK